MEKKGFPESYDLPTLLRFLADVKAGRRPVRAPIYSHLVYDVMPNQWVEVDRPDILIVEGLNVLQAGNPPKDGKAIPYVSDFFDFSVYIDAEEDVLHKWYVDRFLTLRETAFRDPKSYFHRYSNLDDSEAIETATSIWERINLINLRENILPTRQRADLILKKAANHLVQEVALQEACRLQDPDPGLIAPARVRRRAWHPASAREARPAARGRAASPGNHPCRPRGRRRGPRRTHWR